MHVAALAFAVKPLTLALALALVTALALAIVAAICGGPNIMPDWPTSVGTDVLLQKLEPCSEASLIKMPIEQLTMRPTIIRPEPSLDIPALQSMVLPMISLALSGAIPDALTTPALKHIWVDEVDILTASSR